MKKLMLVGIMLFCRTSAHAVSLDFIKSGADYVWSDLKANSGFKIDSSIQLSEYDWKHGQWSYGTAIQFLNEGSYLYTALEATKNISDPSRIGKVDHR